MQPGSMRCGLAGGSCPDVGFRWAGQIFADDPAAGNTPLWRQHFAVLQWAVCYFLYCCLFSAFLQCTYQDSLFLSVIIMSSILENMCSEVLQQTATQIKFAVTGSEPVPYVHRLPTKKPIKEVLHGAFTTTLEKGWVDIRSLHIFDTLLQMGGVYWFCNNLVKVCRVFGW